MLRLPPDDGSRDRSIDDPSNTWLVHLLGRLLLRPALRAGVNPNAVSVAGFACGAAAAAAYSRWYDLAWATFGFALSLAWLVFDGLDGMIARARGSASEFGRMLDGLCDHGAFVLLYVSLAASLGSRGAWLLAIAAGAMHAVQASLFEGERARYHRRVRGDGGSATPAPPRNVLVGAYEQVSGFLDRWAGAFDRALREGRDSASLVAAYRVRARPPLRLMALLTNNVRVLAIYLACLASDPRLFWIFELGPLTLVAAAGIVWHRRVEADLLRGGGGPSIGAA